MKIAVKLMLFLFLTFLATPTVISLIERNAETAVFFSITEEELSIKEIKIEVKLTSQHSVLYATEFTSRVILYENLSKHDNVFTTIFNPPPEQV